MKKFEFWVEDTGEVVYIMEEDTITAFDVAKEMFGTVELLTVNEATEEDIKEE